MPEASTLLQIASNLIAFIALCVSVAAFFRKGRKEQDDRIRAIETSAEKLDKTVALSGKDIAQLQAVQSLKKEEFEKRLTALEATVHTHRAFFQHFDNLPARTTTLEALLTRVESRLLAVEKKVSDA